MKESAPVTLIPENPAPEGGECFWFHAHDGAKLRVMTWKAASAREQGTIFLFNGRTEFIEKYFEVVGELLSRGFSVVTLDWRGQGLSARLLADPRKGHIDDFSKYDRDLDQLMTEVAPSFPKPWSALAHSMGGQILLRALVREPGLFPRAVMSAPMLGLRFSPVMHRAVRSVAAVLSRTGFATRYVPGGDGKSADEDPFTDNILTHDERRYALMQALIRAEQGLALGAPTSGWLQAAFRSMEAHAAPSVLRSVLSNVLIFKAEEDHLIASASLDHAAQHIPSVTLVSIPGARHEILIERDEARALFWQAFDRFMGIGVA